MIWPQFGRYLLNQGLTKTTQKNYLCDTRHFLSWVKRGGYQKYWFDCQTIKSYKNSLIKAQTPLSTISRRLVSLRRFGDFLTSQEIIKKNPARNISGALPENQPPYRPVLKQFQRHLKEQGRKEATVKNYLGDVRQFLTWAGGE